MCPKPLTLWAYIFDTCVQTWLMQCAAYPLVWSHTHFHMTRLFTLRRNMLDWSIFGAGLCHWHKLGRMYFVSFHFPLLIVISHHAEWLTKQKKGFSPHGAQLAKFRRISAPKLAGANLVLSQSHCHTHPKWLSQTILKPIMAFDSSTDKVVLEIVSLISVAHSKCWPWAHE